MNRVLTDAELLHKVRTLALEMGGWPSVRAVQRACSVGRPRARGALDALREEGFDPAPKPSLDADPDAAQTQADSPADAPETRVPGDDLGALDEASAERTERPEIAVEALVKAGATDGPGVRPRRVPRWPLLIIALPAFVAVWSGWVGLGELTGFGPVALLPGIADGWVINSAITLPIGVEAYGAYALWVWLADAARTHRARRFAMGSAIGALVLGALGQVAYHLLAAAEVDQAPWQITAFVSVLPVAVVGCAGALIHLQHRKES